ncbi:MAG: undecaprenyl-diphosphate phosphatase [Solirubrobacterales bacterium]
MTQLEPRLPLRHALVLGLVHGPTELLPVSSSAHTALLPRLAGWPAAELDPEQAKTLEVALHAGAALELALALRAVLWAELRRLDRRRLGVLALSLAPPALVGYALEGPIERRLGGPRTVAFGLAAGGLAMAVADLRGLRTRTVEDAGPCDGLLLGLAQALALLPGVSRNGATLTAARARGFTRADSQALSWLIALPVLLGAAALKGRRLAQRGVPPGLGAPLGAGAGAAFVSTLACSPLVAPGRRSRSLLPFSLYRGALAALVIRARVS